MKLTLVQGFSQHISDIVFRRNVFERNELLHLHVTQKMMTKGYVLRVLVKHWVTRELNRRPIVNTNLYST